jgi:glyoxylase-like metal-dependent hydrolase (beta-lactamase superfamily II)
MVTIIPIDTPTLADRSYLAHDGSIALVVDPQRDIDRVLEVAANAGVRITHVFETHIHSDYVTGGAALAAETGAAYHVNADDPVAFDRVLIADGDLIAIGDRMRLTVLATPGHTYTHLSYALAALDGDRWASAGVFTGGALLHGAVGRPDLLGSAHTHALGGNFARGDRAQLGGRTHRPSERHRPLEHRHPTRGRRNRRLHRPGSALPIGCTQT